MLPLISSNQLVKHLSGLANDVLNYPAVSKCWLAEKKKKLHWWSQSVPCRTDAHAEFRQPHIYVCVSIGNVIIPYNKHIWLRMQAVLFPLSRLHSSGQSWKYPTAADKKADLGSFLTTWGCANANTQTHTPLITFIHSRTKKTDTEQLQLPVSNTGT